MRRRFKSCHSFLFEKSSDRALLEAQQRCDCDYNNGQPYNPVRARSEWPFHEISAMYSVLVRMTGCGRVLFNSGIGPGRPVMRPRDEAELRFTDGQHVAVAQGVTRDFSVIHEHSVGAVEIFDYGIARPHHDNRMVTTHGAAIDPQFASRRPANARALCQYIRLGLLAIDPDQLGRSIRSP
jgi:hypothetical protein